MGGETVVNDEHEHKGHLVGLGGIGVTFGIEGGSVNLVWSVERQVAERLAAQLKAQLGEPTQETFVNLEELKDLQETFEKIETPAIWRDEP